MAAAVRFWLDCRAMARLLPLLLLLVSACSHGQTWEVGARYWLSSGNTVRAHNAQGVDPTLGNPTSVLQYDTLTGHAIELHARKVLDGRWFGRGNLGVGWVRKGWFDDEDFNAGQQKFSDSTSTVKDSNLAYATVDLGREMWVFGENKSTVSLFVGYNYWNERLDAYGAFFTTGGNSTIEESVLVITNEVSWHSFRLGMAFDARVTPRTRLLIDVALVPYARVRDEDSHYLRQSSNDLGPVPNIIMEGHAGSGVQLDVELRHLLRESWELGLGLRYWDLRASRGSRRAAGTNVPITEIESHRAGVTLSLTRRW